MAFTAGTAGAIRAVPANAGHFGQGVSYPIAIDARGRIKLTFGPDLVAEALSSIAQTQPGERCMEPDYGAGVLLFEPIDEDRVRYAFEQNIADHEPRVKSAQFSVRLGQTASDSEITIAYQVAGEAGTRTLTAPFYAGPATTSAAGT